MLLELKERLATAQALVEPELATTAEYSDSVDDLPTALLYFGQKKFDAATGDVGKTQQGITGVEIQLTVVADQLESVEEAVIRAMVGYVHNEQYMPLEFFDANTLWINGIVYSRLLRFGAARFIRY
ncbi:hypothetical protein ACKC9G_18460 [Pokkaliibacter sp. CJK22405]|uniref:hypothetical protein n=1 Tax=Pokkaliibacter sp. CJK22405 TaxID=3384615 RepID=UPI00398509AA